MVDTQCDGLQSVAGVTEEVGCRQACPASFLFVRSVLRPIRRRPSSGQETRKRQAAARSALAHGVTRISTSTDNIRKQRELFYEQFVWKDGNASDVAHQTPEVMAVWEPMGPVLEDLTICEVEPV